MKILLLDNYDSFTYNLAQILDESQMCEFDIVKNDKINVSQVAGYDKILLSPGPDVPQSAGIMPQIIADFFDKKPIFGVCLGMQAIAEFFGAELYNLKTVFHGVKEKINVIGNSLIFSNLSEVQQVGLYHSWAVSKNNFPQDLRITAISESDVIMAIEHKDFPVYGVQFHPESYMTENGKKIIENWLKLDS